MSGVTSGYGIEHFGAVRRAEIGGSRAGVTPLGGGYGVHAHPAHRVGYRAPGDVAARATACGDLNLRLTGSPAGGRQRGGVPAAQPAGINDYRQRGQGHGGGGDDRGEPDAGEGVEDPGGDRDSDGVVGEGEEQVLPDITHGCFRQGDRGDDPGEGAGDEGDVGGLDRHVGAGADRQPDVGSGEGGGIV